MRKKVLFMIDSLGCGGAERSLVSLLPLLDYSMLDIDLLLVGRGGIFEKYVPKEVNIIPFSPNCKTFLQKFRLILSKIKFSISLRYNIFRKDKLNPPHMEWITCGKAYQPHAKEYDVAIAFQQGFPCYYVMEKIKAKRKIAWINVDIFKTKHKPWFVKPFYDRYDEVVTVSDAIYKKIIANGLVSKEKLHCVYDVLNPELIKKQSLEPLKLIERRFVITTVGRLIPHHKGQDLGLMAAKILKEKGLEFEWHFVGDGPGMSELKRMAKRFGIEDNVIFDGMQPNPYPYIQAADLYVQTSRFEGFGLTITEAKILGKPIVTTNFPSAFNQIEQGKNGLIVDMTPEAIAEAIEKCMSDFELRKMLSEANLSYRNTTSETEVKKVIDLILQN